MFYSLIQSHIHFGFAKDIVNVRGDDSSDKLHVLGQDYGVLLINIFCVSY